MCDQSVGKYWVTCLKGSNLGKIFLIRRIVHLKGKNRATGFVYHDDFYPDLWYSTFAERKAYRSYLMVDSRVLNPLENATRSGHWHSAYEKQDDAYMVAFPTLIVTMVASVALDPTGYLRDGTLAILTVLAGIVIDLLLTKRHGKKLESDFHERRKSVYYQILMAQVLARSLVMVGGVEFEL